MDKIRCPICKKCPTEPVNLRCEHHPCYQCIRHFVAIDPESKLEVKYKLSCPTCKKKTVFYDLRHLLITAAQTDQEDVIISCKLVSSNSHKPSNSSSHSDVQKIHLIAQNQQINSKRGSIQSIANTMNVSAGRDINFQCPQHSHPIKYFCDDCHTSQRKSLLCFECYKSHVSQKHQILSIRQAFQKITSNNQSEREKFAIYLSQIHERESTLQQQRKSLLGAYEKVEEELNESFKGLYLLISNKYQALRAELKQQFEGQSSQISKALFELAQQKDNFTELQSFDLKSIEEHLEFYNNCQSVKGWNFRLSLDFSGKPTLVRKDCAIENGLDEWMQLSICGSSLSRLKSEKCSSKKSRKPSVLEGEFSLEKQNCLPPGLTHLHPKRV